nr:citrate lyase holo-[acyl-carrier protein] synthase [uncultured Blautia sp.]
MSGEEVTLIQMLDCRERRSHFQKELLKKYHCPVISFCMNIPGPIKTNKSICSAFNKGKEALFQSLAEKSAVICEFVEIHEATGDELLAAVKLSAEELKALTTAIENTHPVGRLFDMDVIDTDGQKLSRSDFRKCILCGRQAQECSRMRRHTVREMQDKIEEILGK